MNNFCSDYFCVENRTFLYDSWNLISEAGQRPAVAPSTHAIAGKLNINPSNSPQNEFVLTLPDGQTIDNFHKDFPGYSGPAVRIHIKPKGRLDGLLVDGAPYELDNSKAYDIASGSMTVHVYNDSVKKGKAMGQWWISIEATGATIADSHSDLSGIAAPATPDTPSLNYTNTYTWGLDLSGSLGGAGGIGGLLSVTRSTSSGTAIYYPCYDGNGNITDYVNTNGIVVAHREYDPFGNTIVATGPMVNDFSFWFSTKYLDQETGLYYYGYRYYSPSVGRFLSRDPIGEIGHWNVNQQFKVVMEVYRIVGMLPLNIMNRGYYNYVRNEPVSDIDYLGLTEIPADSAKPGPEPCYRPPCTITDFKIADNGSKGTHLKMKASYNAQNCVNLKLYWWTCTWAYNPPAWRQDPMDDDFAGSVMVIIYGGISAWSCENCKWTPKKETSSNKCHCHLAEAGEKELSCNCSLNAIPGNPQNEIPNPGGK